MGAAVEQQGLTGLLAYKTPSGDDRQQLVWIMHRSAWRLRVRSVVPIEVADGARATLILEDEQGLMPVPVRFSWFGQMTGLRVLAVAPEVRLRFRALLKGATDSSGVIRTVRAQS